MLRFMKFELKFVSKEKWAEQPSISFLVRKGGHLGSIILIFINYLASDMYVYFISYLSTTLEICTYAYFI